MTTEFPLITIALIAKNRAWCLPRALKSIEQMDYPKKRIRIIMIDNESTDHTLELIENFKNRLDEQYEKIITLTSAGNIPTLRNICLEKADGEYILYHDSDYIVPEDTLKRALDIYASNSKAAIVGYPCQREFPSLIEQMIYNERVKMSQPQVVMVGEMAPVIRIAIARQVGGYDINYSLGDDHAFIIRVNNAGYQTILDPTKYVIHIKLDKPGKMRKEVWGYARYSYGALAQHISEVMSHSKWNAKARMIAKLTLYLAVAIALPIIIASLLLSWFQIAIPLLLLYAAVFLFHFVRSRGKWRLFNGILFPFFGVCLALGVVKAQIRSII